VAPSRLEKITAFLFRLPVLAHLQAGIALVRSHMAIRFIVTMRHQILPAGLDLL
jgi:hypothetical protein